MFASSINLQRKEDRQTDKPTANSVWAIAFMVSSPLRQIAVLVSMETNEATF